MTNEMNRIAAHQILAASNRIKYYQKISDRHIPRAERTWDWSEVEKWDAVAQSHREILVSLYNQYNLTNFPSPFDSDCSERIAIKLAWYLN